jgi:hypothetical protein
MKWCNGYCERLLPFAAFYLNAHGNPQARCKACHRIYSRESFRKNYDKDKNSARVQRWRDRHREQFRASRRATYWRRKLAA